MNRILSGFVFQMFANVDVALVLVVVVVLAGLCQSVRALDSDLTVIIPANQRECFHQEFDQGKTITVEYEVLAGGDMDINYWLYSPSNRVLQSDFKKHDGHQTLKLDETGTYQFCFDNSFSRFVQKKVYFSVRLINEQGVSEDNHLRQPWMDNMRQDDLGDLQSKVQDIKVSVALITALTSSSIS